MARTVVEHGRVVPMTFAVNRMREKLDLPPLQEPAMDEISKIIQASGFDKILALYKGRDTSE
ncbi:MAG: hypothetical protein ACXAEE_11975, partial [Candidatus Thorarchaeota archaeon]|jgi:hypothetical protein